MTKEQEYQKSLIQSILTEFLGLISKRQEIKLNRNNARKIISNCKILQNYNAYFKGRVFSYKYFLK